MNTQFAFLRNAIALTLATFAMAQASAAQDATTMTVDDTAPLHATLLPTVRVTATAPELAVVTLPTVRVVADALVEPKTEAVAYRGNDEIAPARLQRMEGATLDREMPLRARVMPR